MSYIRVVSYYVVDIIIKSLENCLFEFKFCQPYKYYKYIYFSQDDASYPYYYYGSFLYTNFLQFVNILQVEISFVLYSIRQFYRDILLHFQSTQQ